MSYHPGSGFSSLSKYFLQEHEQGQEESLSKKEGKKWIIREEKQQQEEKYQQVWNLFIFKLGMGGGLRK